MEQRPDLEVSRLSQYLSDLEIEDLIGGIGHDKKTSVRTFTGTGDGDHVANREKVGI